MAGLPASVVQRAAHMAESLRQAAERGHALTAAARAAAALRRLSGSSQGREQGQQEGQEKEGHGQGPLGDVIQLWEEVRQDRPAVA